MVVAKIDVSKLKAKHLIKNIHMNIDKIDFNKEKIYCTDWFPIEKRHKIIYDPKETHRAEHYVFDIDSKEILIYCVVNE